MPDPGEPWQSGPGCEPSMPDPADYASYADYLLAVDAFVRAKLAAPAGDGLTELDIRRQAIELQVEVEALLAEAAGE
jgi:hypothetical protein